MLLFGSQPTESGVPDRHGKTTAVNTILPTRRRRPRLLVALVATVALLAGCGLRLETPPPPSPTPDASEVARQRASADSLVLEALAAPGGPAGPVADVRSMIAQQAAEHVAQLGPARPSNTPSVTARATPSATARATPAPSGTPDAVVAQLVATATNARKDAAAVPDGSLARLLGSVSTARLLLARQLAATAGLPVPALPDVTMPTSVPDGLAPSALSALVADEDEAGYADEVIAAKLSDPARSSAMDRAAVHRDRAEQWAKLAQIGQTGLDPRRTAYALGALDDPAVATALAASLEGALATTYAALTADATPDSRPVLLDALTDAAAAATAWGAAVPAFPGMPDLSR